MGALSLERKNNFDAVRILAASAVIYGHAHPLTATGDLVFLGNSVQSFAVKVFFIISGFLVARSWHWDPSPFRYLAKRMLRIFPGLLLLLAATVVLGACVTTLPISTYFTDPGTRFYFFYNALLYPAYSLPGVFAGLPYPVAVNGSLWSLPVEFLMYLVFPLVYWVSRRLGGSAFLVFFAAALCCASLYWVRVAPVSVPFVFYGTGLPSVLDVAPYFFLGSVFALTGVSKHLNPSVALFLIGVLVFFRPDSGLWMELALYLVAPYCVLAFATSASPVLQHAGRYGDPSYGIYLYGWPMQQLALLLVPNLTPIGNTLIALPLAAIAAYGSWHLIEKRALAIKPSRNPESIVKKMETA
jgi:peptidoglycan/LPS O-acetylase OafA/YrhL